MYELTRNTTLLVANKTKAAPAVLTEAV